MSIGKKLTGRLKQASEGSVEVDDGEVRVTADVVGSGPYGAEVRKLSVERVEPRGEEDPSRSGRMDRAVEKLEEKLSYLPERVAPLEIDERSGRGVMRTRRGDVRDREYYEITVDGGDRIDIGRYRGASEGGRDRVGENFGHGIIERLVEDFSEVVRDRRERVRGDEDSD